MVRPAALVMASALLLWGCGDRDDPDAAPEPGDVAAARVSGETVWTSDVRRAAVEEGVITEGEPLDVSDEAFPRLLDGVIDQKLLAQEAVRLKLDADPAVRRRLSDAREAVLGAALVDQAVETAVTEDEVRRLYSQFREGERESEQARLSQILVTREAEAADLKRRLDAGGDFDTLAMERSLDADTRFNGGDLGYVDLALLPAGVATAVRGASPGARLGPLRVEGGWAVLRVDAKRRVPVQSLEEIRPQILRFLSFDRVRGLLSELREGAEVEVLTPSPPTPAAPASAAAVPAAPPAVEARP